MSNWDKILQNVKGPLIFLLVKSRTTELSARPSRVRVQTCLTLCESMDCIPPGCSVRGILQARTLEWVAISFSRASSRPGPEPASLAPPALAEGLCTSSPPGKPECTAKVTQLVRRKADP